jgi:hypothetical protein
METTQDSHRDDSRPPHPRTPVEVGAHKLFPPPVKPTAIGRQAILDRLLRSPVERAIILQAPAGSGKSTTLQQLMSAYSSAGWATGWLTFDDADNDPRRFEAHIHALMAVVERGAGKPARPTTDEEGIQPTLAHWMLDALSRFERPVALFLDELQALRSDSTLRFFRELLPRLPQQSRVFIGSRTLPDVGVATLRVNGVAIVLRARDLRFSADEASEFFAKDIGSGIGAGEIGAIYQRTEGWPAGLQLFRLALASPEVRSSLEDIEHHGPRELAEYLTDNVVALQAPPVQEFLLRTSLLRRLSGPLCDAVLGRTGSQPMLLELERSGLFLTALDSSTGFCPGGRRPGRLVVAARRPRRTRHRGAMVRRAPLRARGEPRQPRDQDGVGPDLPATSRQAPTSDRPTRGAEGPRGNRRDDQSGHRPVDGGSVRRRHPRGGRDRRQAGGTSPERWRFPRLRAGRRLQPARVRADRAR